ncbi:isoprenyl transferase-like [Ornithodoros turicata]|uniref:isoprenyl transferase-like n=1 Tax=Ornithodoros turicata TaxID=34597 RepID=UPI003138A73E
MDMGTQGERTDARNTSSATTGSNAGADEHHCKHFDDVKLPWYQRVILWMLSLGCVPRSMAIIPDGNRRYAKKVGASVNEGHLAGAQRMDEVGRWAEKMGIKEVTIYVFSTHNFKRPKDEIDGIFDEIQKYSNNVIDEPHAAERKQVCARCVGDLEMLPRHVQVSLAKLEMITSPYSKRRTNFCIAYSARHQLTRITEKMARAVKEQLLKPEDITTSLIGDLLAVEEAPDIDLLMRTSGETRLSDFLLWQTSYAMLYFEVRTLPEVSFWDFIKGVLYYQVRARAIQGVRERHQEATATLEKCCPEQLLRQRIFLKQMEADRILYVRQLTRDD